MHDLFHLYQPDAVLVLLSFLTIAIPHVSLSHVNHLGCFNKTTSVLQAFHTY